MKIEKKISKLVHYYETDHKIRSLVRDINSWFPRKSKTEIKIILDNDYPDLGLTNSLTEIDWLSCSIYGNNAYCDFNEGSSIGMFWKLGKTLGLNDKIREFIKVKDVFVHLNDYNEFIIFWNSDKERKELISICNSEYEDLYFPAFYHGLKGIKYIKASYGYYYNFLLYLAGYDLFLERSKNG